MSALSSWVWARAESFLRGSHFGRFQLCFCGRLQNFIHRPNWRQSVRSDHQENVLHHYRQGKRRNNNIAERPVFAYWTIGLGTPTLGPDRSGNGILYVDNGAWQVELLSPVTDEWIINAVTVAGANQSGINFARPAPPIIGNVLGTVFGKLPMRL